MIWLLKWTTESGDDGIEAYWTKKPTAKQIAAAIDGSDILAEERDSGTLHTKIVTVALAKN